FCPARMAAMAASSTSEGPSVSGKPWPRLTAPVATAKADISAKIVVPKPWRRRLSACPPIPQCRAEGVGAGRSEAEGGDETSVDDTPHALDAPHGHRRDAHGLAGTRRHDPLACRDGDPDVAEVDHGRVTPCEHQVAGAGGLGGPIDSYAPL